MRYFLSLTITVLFCYTGSAQSITEMWKAAREKGFDCFVVYENGDTVKGENLKVKGNPFSKNEKWIMDGKEISSSHIYIWQDKETYNMRSLRRIVKGKANMYDVRDREFFTFLFRIGDTAKMQDVSFLHLRNNMKDCPAALDEIQKQYQDLSKKDRGNPDSGPIVKNAVRIFEIYNGCFGTR